MITAKQSFENCLGANRLADLFGLLGCLATFTFLSQMLIVLVAIENRLFLVGFHRPARRFASHSPHPSASPPSLAPPFLQYPHHRQPPTYDHTT